jgi:catechol 2,3-dioxygenase-like lactoylglutathione lyase family enzyme
MLSHVFVGVTDFERAFGFYSALMSELGLRLRFRGGTCAGLPGLRPHYHPDYHGAYFRDPDGNKLCICCHTPPTC